MKKNNNIIDAMGVFQIVTDRGHKPISGIICDLAAAKHYYDRYNAERAAAQQRNTDRQTAWDNGYHAAQTEQERAAWLAHKARKERVPCKATLVGVVW